MRYASNAEMIIRALKKNKLVNQLLHVKDGAEALDFLFLVKGSIRGGRLKRYQGLS